MNYNFKIGKGLGNINLKLNEDNIFRLLGKPNKVEKTTGNKCYTYDYDYDNLGISIILNYDEFDEPKNTMQIHTENIEYEARTWKSLNKNEL